MPWNSLMCGCRSLLRFFGVFCMNFSIADPETSANLHITAISATKSLSTSVSELPLTIMSQFFCFTATALPAKIPRKTSLLLLDQVKVSGTTTDARSMQWFFIRPCGERGIRFPARSEKDPAMCSTKVELAVFASFLFIKCKIFFVVN